MKDKPAKKTLKKKLKNQIEEVKEVEVISS